MKLVAQITVSLFLSAGLTLFATFCCYTFATKELQPGADATTRLIYTCGRLLPWLGAGALALLLMTAAALVVWRALGVA